MSRSGFLPGLLPRIADAVIDSVVRNIQQRIDELQSVAVVRSRHIKSVELPDATNVTVPHGLGRPASVFVSPVRGDPSTSGRIEDVTEVVGADRKRVIVLFAGGWGTTVTVDLLVF